MVRGDGDDDPEALREAGRVTVRHLVGMLSDGMTLTVSGGQCVAAAAEAALREAPALDVSVLPGQGGTDADLSLQAGTLAARFAAALGGRHAQLHVPDRLTPEALRSLMELPDVSAAVNAMHRTDVLLFGMERADEAMKTQPLPESESGFNAVGEALGSYFDADGRLVYKASSIGLSGEELRRVPHVIAVATGASRAQAVMAVMRHHHHDLLVIDEGAARAIAAAL